MNNTAKIERGAMFKLTYGVFVLTAREGGRDSGCVINTALQIAESPARISIAVNKANHTHNMVLNTGVFNVSVLAENAGFAVFERFGFHSGRDTDKFADCGYDNRAENGVRYVPEGTNAVLCAKVSHTVDCGTHTLFIAEVTEAFALSNERSATYQYYFDHIKPKPQSQPPSSQLPLNEKT
jgi:flavin reductase (DIM6/NTAB) family NADH-FMN oxidoreductase RutF